MRKSKMIKKANSYCGTALTHLLQHYEFSLDELNRIEAELGESVVPIEDMTTLLSVSSQPTSSRHTRSTKRHRISKSQTRSQKIYIRTGIQKRFLDELRKYGDNNVDAPEIQICATKSVEINHQ